MKLQSFRIAGYLLTAAVFLLLTQKCKTDVVSCVESILEPDAVLNATGVITISASGGVAPYEFSLDNSSFGTNNVFNDKVYEEATYKIGVKDAEGCVRKMDKHLQKTSTTIPIVTTNITVDSITRITAKSGGNVTSEGGATVTARGVCWSTGTTPTIADNKTVDGNGTGSFISSITGLTAITNYYVRAYATNSEGTGYGTAVPFSTLANSAPVLTTTAAVNIDYWNATSGGTITDNGGTSITARGVCWSATPNPTITNDKTSDGSGTGSFSSSITGLHPFTLYYYRAYATNIAGNTGYGNQLDFKTPDPCDDTTIFYFYDSDGTYYRTVKIGNQCWMKENLRVVAGIPIVTDDTQWANLTTAGVCFYDNDDVVNRFIYGNLYNWDAVRTGTLCPSGWHIPTDAEWQQLVDFLGGDAVAGGAMKATTGWIAPNTGATNSSGFSALPGGSRYGSNGGGLFGGVGWLSWFWSSTENGTDAWSRDLGYDRSNVGHSSYGNDGFSCRCVRDD